MRLNSHWSWPRLRLPQARGWLLAMIAALGALALVVSACSLTAGPTTGNNGFSSNTGSVTTGKGQTTKVTILRGGGGTAMILVPVTIDDHGPYDFALDTGAGITLIDTQLADTLQLPVTGNSAQVAGVGERRMSPRSTWTPGMRARLRCPPPISAEQGWPRSSRALACAGYSARIFSAPSARSPLTMTLASFPPGMPRSPHSRP